VSLTVRGLQAAYGSVTVLHDVELEVPLGQIVALVGANGAGKSTLLRCLAGLHRATHGEVRLGDQVLTRLPAHVIARRGLALVPEGRQLFRELTVAENLRLGLYGSGIGGGNRSPEARRRLGYVHQLFPILHEFAERQAGALSGGQQQMLAIGRALVREPKVLLLDEPSLGLAPRVTAELFLLINGLRSSGSGVLLVEQNAMAALRIADLGCVMESGRLEAPRPAAELLGNDNVGRSYLGSGGRSDGEYKGTLDGVIGTPLL
jgi:branched-chain amino acid transport system ATP-binding protein